MIRMRAMTCGRLECDAAPMLEGAKGRIQIPIPSFLIEHPKGRVVFDSGLHPDLQRNSDRLGPLAKMFQPLYDRGEDVASRLRSFEVDPDSIEILVNSHLHFDHTGGNALLKNARIVLQRSEWIAGTDPDCARANGFDPRDYDLGHDVITVDGEHDLFGDGSIICMPTYGHTPGHQSLRVQLSEGEVVLAADACYFRETLDELRLPIFGHDLDMMRKTLLRLRRIRESGTRIFYGHDPNFWKRVPQAPLDIT